MKHEIIKFYPLQVCYVKHKHESYVMILVIKHDMDPNSNINCSRKIGPMLIYYVLKGQDVMKLNVIIQTVTTNSTHRRQIV